MHQSLKYFLLFVIHREYNHKFHPVLVLSHLQSIVRRYTLIYKLLRREHHHFYYWKLQQPVNNKVLHLQQDQHHAIYLNNFQKYNLHYHQHSYLHTIPTWKFRCCNTILQYNCKSDLKLTYLTMLLLSFPRYLKSSRILLLLLGMHVPLHLHQLLMRSWFRRNVWSDYYKLRFAINPYLHGYLIPDVLSTIYRNPKCAIEFRCPINLILHLRLSILY